MANSASAAIRVLVVDDDATNRRLVREALKRSDKIEIVGEARNGREAVTFASASPLDVIVMDLEMPELDGLEATRQIRATCPQIKVVMFSSKTGMTDIHAAFSAGATGYVFKDAPQKLPRAISSTYAGEQFLEP